MHGPHVPVWVQQIWENPPDPIVYLLPRTVDADMRGIETKLTVIMITFAVTAVVFALSYLVSFRFETFRSYLRTKEKVFWCLTFVRAVFGFVASFIGIWYLVFDDTLQKDVVNGNTHTSFVSVYICVGFFVFECVALYISSIIFRSLDPFLFMHHTLSLVGLSTAAYYGNAHYFVAIGMLLEMTTPFSCFCWMFLKAKMSSSKFWKINQIVLVHLFHVRTTVEGYIFYKSYTQWDNITMHMPGPLMFFIFTQLSLQFFLLTPYWTYKKMMQLFNPVDWNHPDLQSPKVNATRVLNGSSDHSKED